MDIPFFCFVHIEKAGGITMHNILHRNFFGYISPDPDPKFGEFLEREALTKLLEYYPAKVCGIGGHRIAAFKNYESLFHSRKIFYFTYIREPISRYMSHFNWQSHYYGMKIEDFVSNPYFSNFQIYRMSGLRSYWPAIDFVESKFDLIGLFEKYDESLVILARMLNMKLEQIRYQKSNTLRNVDRIYYDDLPYRLRRRILECNEDELRFYDSLKSRYSSKFVAEYGKVKLEEDLDLFLEVNHDFEFSAMDLIKRKCSNLYLKRIVQPRSIRRKDG